MKLSIRNVGKLKEADVEINGITVITGENDTGKSTVGKVLWSVFNSFYKVYEQIEKERIDFVNEQIYSYVKNLDKSDNVKKKTLDMAIDIIQNYSIYYRNEENIKNYIQKQITEICQSHLAFLGFFSGSSVYIPPSNPTIKFASSNLSNTCIRVFEPSYG